jgi:hypothetical protein
MTYAVAETSSTFDWVNAVVAVCGVLLAVIALLQTKKANAISAAANKLSEEANRFAATALEMQEDEGKLRLVVKPRMMQSHGVTNPRKASPMVEVINLSAFPVTITAIWWKTDGSPGSFLLSKSLSVLSPHSGFPVRLQPRDQLTALGPSNTFDDEDLAKITAAIARTACDEQVEGMTEQWRESVARRLAASTDLAADAVKHG